MPDVLLTAPNGVGVFLFGFGAGALAGLFVFMACLGISAVFGMFLKVTH